MRVSPTARRRVNACAHLLGDETSAAGSPCRAACCGNPTNASRGEACQRDCCLPRGCRSPPRRRRQFRAGRAGIAPCRRRLVAAQQISKREPNPTELPTATMPWASTPATPIRVQPSPAAPTPLSRLVLSGRAPERAAGHLSAAAGCGERTVRWSPPVTTMLSTWLPQPWHCGSACRGMPVTAFARR